MTSAVVDTTLLSNFAHAQQSDLLHAVSGGLMSTTAAVMAELHAGEEQDLVPVCDWGWLPVLELTLGEERQPHNSASSWVQERRNAWPYPSRAPSFPCPTTSQLAEWRLILA